MSKDYIVTTTVALAGRLSILARNCRGTDAYWGSLSQQELGSWFHPVKSSTRVFPVLWSGDTVSVWWMWPGQPANNAVQVLVSDVDGDGIRDARDPCPRDPFNNTAGGCQRASGAYPLLNDFITLGNVTTETRDSEFVITATFTNTSETPLRNPFFEVTDLSGDNVLINADGGNGGVGATLSPDVGDGVLSPDEPVTATFRIPSVVAGPVYVLRERPRDARTTGTIDWCCRSHPWIP